MTQVDLDRPVLELESVERLVLRVNVVHPERVLALAETGGAFGERRTEGLRRAVERAERGVVREGEAARRRSEREQRDLRSDLLADLVDERRRFDDARI